MLIQEVKRFQHLAGIKENQFLNELNDAEQEITNAILSEHINEAKFSPKEILTKLLYAAKKGILTTAIISSVLASCNFDSKTDEAIKNAIEQSPYEVVDSTQLTQTKDENTATYENTLNKLKSIEVTSPKEDTLQKKVIEYIMLDNVADEIENEQLPNYEKGSEASKEVVVALQTAKKQTNKLKQEIILLTSTEYFNVVNKASKKLIAQSYASSEEYMRNPEQVISIITPSIFSELGFNKASFTSNWNKLSTDVLNGWL